MAEGLARRHWPLAVAALATLLLFAAGLVPGHVFIHRDLGAQFWPVITEARQGADGSADMLPFWTHASTSGRPLVANPGYSFLSPLSLLWLALPPAAAFDWFLLLHAMIAAAGMAALARRLGAGPEASLAAGLALGLGGGAVSAFDLWWALVALAFAPWVLVAGLDACEERSARRLALLALALALQADGGMPEVVLCTLVVGAALALARAHVAWPARVRDAALAWGLGGLWAIALAAPALIPGALHARTTLRAAGFDADRILYNSLDPRALPGLVLPRWGGHPVQALDGGFARGAEWTDTGTPYLLSHDVGLLAGALAIAALLLAVRRKLEPPRRAAVAALAVVAAFGVVVALGRHVPPVRWAAEAVAPFPLRYPVKALFATFLAVPLLAALGLDSLLKRLASPAVAQRLGLALALTAGLELLVAHEGYAPAMDVSQLAEPPLAGVLRSRATALGLREGEWLVHHERLPGGAWGPPPGSIPPTEQAMQAWNLRVLMPPRGMPHGIRHAYDRLGDYMDDAAMIGEIRRIYALPRAEWAQALGEAGILFLVSPSRTLQEESGGALALLLELGPDVGVPPGSGSVYVVTAFRPRLELLGEGRVVSWADDHRGTTVTVECASESALVVREVLGDLGTWTATAEDGTQLPLVRHGACFARVTVPAGTTTLRLRNVPPGWNASLALSATAAAGLLAALLPRRRRREPVTT